MECYFNVYAFINSRIASITNPLDNGTKRYCNYQQTSCIEATIIVLTSSAFLRQSHLTVDARYLALSVWALCKPGKLLLWCRGEGTFLTSSCPAPSVVRIRQAGVTLLKRWPKLRETSSRVPKQYHFNVYAFGFWIRLSIPSDDQTGTMHS